MSRFVSLCVGRVLGPVFAGQSSGKAIPLFGRVPLRTRGLVRLGLITLGQIT